MNFDAIESLWANRPIEENKLASLEDLKQVARAMRRSQSRRFWILACSGVNLSIATLVCACIGLTRAVVHAGEALPLAGALLACWVVYIVLVRRVVAEKRAARHAGESLQDFVSLGLRQVRGESRGLKLVAALMVIVYVPLLPWAVTGLVAAGKMDARAALSFGALGAAQILFFAAFCIANFMGSIRPRAKRLRALDAALGLENDGTDVTT